MKCQAINVVAGADKEGFVPVEQHCDKAATGKTEDGCLVCEACAELFRAEGFKVESLNIDIKIMPSPGIPGDFLAEIRMDGTTYFGAGSSRAEAAVSAGEAVRMMDNECKRPHLKHCFCISEEHRGHDGHKCCICDDWKRD